MWSYKKKGYDLDTTLILTKTMNKLELEVVVAREDTYPPIKLPVRVIVVSELEESFEHISTYKKDSLFWDLLNIVSML